MRGIHHLELFNFKSYRGKHTIGPFKNFSAVVGPNGSGKSNVMDAITFVLGVAAGKIRADQVKELINSYGPDNDTPNTNAYVEMVFENDDGTKVHFRRSIRLVTRSGAGAGGDATVSDTTYAVDGITVPKKTYEQRLNALGITVRTSLSGFQTFPNFLVPQNEVALVAQKTPQQLAQFIEVVSGSAEHARAYDEAEAAMRATEDSFMQAFRQKQSTNREHRQVRELVKEAAEFRAKLDTHAALKNEFYLVQMYYTDKELVAAQEQAKGLRARLRAAEEVAARAAVALEDEQKALGDARRALGKVERQRGEHMRAIVDAQPTAGQLAEQARFLKKTVRDCEAKQQQLAQLREERAAQLRGLERELAELKAAQKRFESQTAAEAARGGVVAPAVLAEYHAIKARVEEETATLREGLAALQRKHTATKAAHAAAETAATAVGRNLASVEASLQAAEVRRAAAATVVEESRAAWEAEKVTLAALEQRGETSVARKEELLARIARNNQAMADAAVDEVQVARLSRLNDSLSTLKALYPGLIRGRLSDLVQPVSGEYNRAVSVALGRDLDAIVVADDDTAFKCMDYLKRQRAGIATFLPLASLRVQPPSEYLRQLIGGSLKLVLDVVTYSDVDKKAVLYACGNALVARDLDEARRFQFGDMGARIRRALAEANESGGGGDDDDDGAPGPGAGGGQRFKVVTLDGSILHKSGNMTGGVRASGGNDRFTDAAVARMREETQGFVEELARLTSASGSAAAEARSRQQHRITALHTKLAVAQDEVARLQSEIGLYTARVAVLRADLEKKKRPELAAAQRAVDAAASELAGAEKQATSIAAERFKGFVKAQKAASLEQWEQTQLRAAQAARETAGKFTVQVSRLEAQIAYERARAAEDAAPAETLAKRAKAAQRDHDEAVKALHKLDDVITGHETALAKLGDAFKRAEEAVAARFAVFKAGRAALEAAEADVALVRKELSLVQLRHSGVIAARNELLRKAVMEQAVLPLTRLKKNGTAAAAAGTGPGRKGKRRASDAASPSKRARRPAGSYDDGSDDEEEEEEDDEGNDDGRSGRSSRGGVGRGAAMTDVMSQSLPFSMSDADPSSSAGSGAGTGSSSGTQPETEIGSAFAGTLAPTDVLIDYANLPIEDSISGLTTAAEVEELRGHYQLRLQQMWAEIESASPNARATEHEADLADRVRATATLFAEKQQAQKRAAEEYEAVKATRRKLFLDAFNAISATIDPIYKILSASVGPGGEQLAGGRAELTLENPDEPYKSGIVYSATPPQKRFRDVSQLSGGEKTMAALALLFAIHSYRSAPFFVLDEVDAALDQYNVSRVAAYLRARSTGAVPGLSGAAAGIGSRRGAAAGDAPLQCIVISLKDALYSEADALVGVYRNAEAKSSALVTLDLQPYRKAEEDVDDEETAEGELV